MGEQPTELSKGIRGKRARGRINSGRPWNINRKVGDVVESGDEGENTESVKCG